MTALEVLLGRQAASARTERTGTRVRASGHVSERRVFERVGAGELSEIVESKSSGLGRRCCFGGFSWYTRIREPNGQEIGRLHYLECVFGHVIARATSVGRRGSG